MKEGMEGVHGHIEIDISKVGKRNLVLGRVLIKESKIMASRRNPGYI